MALVVGELYEALKLAQIPDDQARAATAVADFERRIGRIETLVSVDAAVLAMNTALVIAVPGRLFQFFRQAIRSLAEPDVGPPRWDGRDAASLNRQPASEHQAHLALGIPRSLQILRARWSSTSLCRGTAERLF